MTPNIKSFLVAVIFFTPGFLFSQEIITDRPDRTESVETVGKNRFQLETGMEYSFFKLDNVLIDTSFTVTDIRLKNLIVPTTLLRFGILENVELRLGLDFDKQNYSIGSDISGSSNLTLNPLTFGAKVELGKGSGFVPDLSVLGAVKIPNVGDESKQVKHFVPELVFLFSNEINDKFSVGYNIGVEWSDDLEERNYFYSVSLGMGITSRLGAFAEFFGDLKTDVKNSNQNIDGGFTYLIKNNIQVDIYGGLGLTNEANNFMLGTGIAFKF